MTGALWNQNVSKRDWICGTVAHELVEDELLALSTSTCVSNVRIVVHELVKTKLFAVSAFPGRLTAPTRCSVDAKKLIFPLKDVNTFSLL